jgi:hypothetical protein
MIKNNILVFIFLVVINNISYSASQKSFLQNIKLQTASIIRHRYKEVQNTM